MKNLKIGSIVLLAVGMASIGSAIAQSTMHAQMDARSARADIRRLKMDRRMAVRNHNWGKVAQDNRLIAADRHFIRKDMRAGG